MNKAFDHYDAQFNLNDETAWFIIEENKQQSIEHFFLQKDKSGNITSL